jgi:hypothetical protein
MSNTHDRLKDLAGLGSTGSGSWETKKRSAYRKGGCTRATKADGGEPQKPLFGKTEKGPRIGKTIARKHGGKIAREKHGLGELIGNLKSSAGKEIGSTEKPTRKYAMGALPLTPEQKAQGEKNWQEHIKNKAAMYKKGGKSTREEHNIGELVGKLKSGAGEAFNKVKDKLHFEEGGNVKAQRKYYAPNPLMKKREKHNMGELAGKVKAGAEDVGNKIKSGAEDAWGKIRGAFHFEKGGKAKRSRHAMGGVGKIRKDQY